MKKKYPFYFGLLFLSFLVFLIGRAGDKRTQIEPEAKPQVKADFGRVPLYFIPNKGQMDERVAYYVQGRDKTIYFTQDGLTIAIHGKRQGRNDASDGFKDFSSFQHRRKLSGLKGGQGDIQSLKETRFFYPEGRPNNAGDVELVERWVVKMDFFGAKPGVRPEGLEETGSTISYFIGKPEDWKTGLATCSKIIYRELWPGVDLVFYGTYDRMKYEFVVRPGADPSVIRLAYTGAERVELAEDGRLRVQTPLGGFEDEAPVAWQELNGKRAKVSVSYVLKKEPKMVNLAEADGAEQNIGRVICGFEVGEYDHGFPLIIDPATFHYSGLIGSSQTDIGRAIAVDEDGNVYITGQAFRENFPVLAGPQLGSYNQDVFVAKIDASGTGVFYCGLIGGSKWDEGNGIAVDTDGNAYITGETDSEDFPVMIGPGLTLCGFHDDVFVLKLNASGTALIYSGYIGGSQDDWGNGIAIDNLGNAYVTGTAMSSDFPVVVGPGLTSKGNGDAFVAKVDTSGTHLVYCGYIGGTLRDEGNGIAVDGSGHAYIAGTTMSSDFPVVVGPGLTSKGPGDAFVAKVNASGTELLYCGYVGGSYGDEGNGIAIDTAGNAYLVGTTLSSDFPVVTGPFLNFKGIVSDAFVTKVNSSGTGFIYSGYIGGSSWDYGHGIAVDNHGNAHIIGYTLSKDNFPVINGPERTYQGNGDAFVARVNASGSNLDYCGYVGGSSIDSGQGIAVDSSNNAYITGQTSSTDFPLLFGPFLTLDPKTGDAFVTKINYSFKPGTLVVTPERGLEATGPVGGPFWPPGQGYSLRNEGDEPIDWTASCSAGWISISPSGGTISPWETKGTNVILNSNAAALPAGVYSDTVYFVNSTNGRGNTSRSARLTVYAMTLDLSGQRSEARAWILRIEYARLNIEITKYAPVNVSNYVLKRKVDNQPYLIIKEFTEADVVNNSIKYNDYPLNRQSTYSYQVEARLQDGSVVARSNELVLGGKTSVNTEKKTLIFERGKK
jgi:hypothetical protein